MKKSNFFLTLFITVSISIVSAQKKEVYVNDDLELISKQEYDRNSGDDYFNLKFDADSIYLNVSVKRIKKGKISNSQLNALKSNLATSSAYFDKDDIIVINYYPGQDAYNSSGDKEMTRKNYQEYLKRLKKNQNIKQFFVYKSPEGTAAYGNINWIKDKNKLIETIFFAIHYPCNSTVIIDSNGNYYSHRGENNVSAVFKILKEKKTFKNTAN
ncbi:hypothetical protein QO200_16465 [Flavobacterium sp. Arc3]|uniref:hypothetical protein n=1 Tax=Flavobacterium sp. Arc3 TaxID=3046686 RepID=UPI00352C1FFD